MAALGSCHKNFSLFLYFLSTFTILTKIDGFELSWPNPSAPVVEVHQLDGSHLNNDASKNFYHIHKRSVNSSPIKKATALSEKKLAFKSSMTESSIYLKFPLDFKSKLENITLSLNATEQNATTEALSVSAEKPIASPLPSGSTTVNTTVAASDSTVSSSTVSPISSSTSTSSITSDYEDGPLPTMPSSITNTTYDYHVYYNSTLYLEEKSAMSFWVDFDKLPQEQVVVNRMLSDSHRKAATVPLSFDFPFYGHPLRNITIATGGFIYMGDYMHSWLAATQYIAPLMANFDTSLSNESKVRYFDNGTAFVIEWHEVTLQDDKKDANFTFQTILLKTGDVIFVYEVIPVPVTQIGDEAHPVKVGLSDAYVIDRIIYFIRRKTIYEYHRINMKKDEISNHTAIYFTAIPTCMSHQNCSSCMDADTGLDCIWCEATKRCSDGLDRLRQAWLQSKCDLNKSVNCSNLPKPDVNPFVQPLTESPFKPYTIYPHSSDYFDSTTIFRKAGQNSDEENIHISARVSEESSSIGVGSVVAILLVLAVLLGGLVWVGYAYRNPHTSSGQMLIRYRPTQWRFRSGEARYTAASVHM